MELDEGGPDKAPRPMLDAAGVRERHHVADADLRRQRESKVETPGGRFDTPLEDPGVRGLETPGAEGNHRGEMRLERRDTEVAPLQSQSLAPDDDRSLVKKIALSSSLSKDSTGAIPDQKEPDRSDPRDRSRRSRIQIPRSNRSMNHEDSSFRSLTRTSIERER